MPSKVTSVVKRIQKVLVAFISSSSSFELFVLSIMQEDVRAYLHYVSAYALFAILQVDWAITTGRLLGPTTLSAA